MFKKLSILYVCYVFVMPKPVFAEIIGGVKREVDWKNGFFMDGRRSRDFSLAPKAKSFLLYTWSCESKNDPDNTFCDVHISKASVLKIPRGSLNLGKTYNITLEVQSPRNYKARNETFQIIEIVSSNPLYVTIECIRNCRMRKFVAGKSQHLKAECIDCSYGTTIKYEWTINGQIDDKNNQHRLIMENAPDVDVLKIEVIVRYQGRTGLAQIELQKNVPPSGGRCEITPQAGQEAVTLFEINCKGYKDIELPLWYEFQCGGLVLDRTGDAKTKAYLNNDGTVRISICDDLGSCMYETVTASLTPYDNKDDVLMLMENPENSAVELYRNGETLKAMILTDIATAISEGPYEAHFISARMQRFQLETFIDIERFTSAGSMLLQKLHPYKHESVAAADKYLSQLVEGFQYLCDDGEVEWIDILNYESYQSHIAFMLNSLQSQTEPPNKIHLFGLTLAHACYRIDEIYEDIEVGDVEVALRLSDWLTSHLTLYKCLNFLGIMAAYAHEPEDPSTISNFPLARFETFSFDQRRSMHLVPADGVADIFIDSSIIFELQMLLGTKEIIFQLITTKTNLFWWYPDKHDISTGMVQLSAFNRYSRYRVMQEIKLSDSFLINFNLTQYKNVTKNEKYHMRGCLKNNNDMNIFHVRVPRNVMLSITFIASTIDLRVNLSLGEKPYGYFIKNNEQSTIIPKGTSGFSYKPLVVLNNDIDDLDAYLGVIAAEDVGSRHALFTFVPELRACLAWKFNNENPHWTTKYCWPKVKEYMTDGLHCYCQHMSIYAGKIFPIPAFALYGVGNIKDSLPINWYMLSSQVAVGLFFICWALIAYICLSPSRERLIITPRTEDNTIISHEPTGEVIIRFTTGGYRNSSTTAGIILIIMTVQGDLKFKIYQNPTSPLLKRHSTSTVMLPINPEDLKRPIVLSLRHDGGGRYASWYCRHVEIDYKGNTHPVKIVTDTWIGETNAQFIEGHGVKRKKNTKWKRFANNLEVISTNWFLHNPLTGPWKYGNQTCNRFERSLIWMIKIAIAILTVSLLFGWTMLGNYEDERHQYRYINIDISQALTLSFISFIIGSVVQFGVEYWMSRFSSDSNI